MHRRRLAISVAAVVAMLPLSLSAADQQNRPELLVFAAASLTDVLAELSARWEATAGVPVRLSFAASAVLARQIEAGGRADVFISADQEWMNYLQARDLLEPSTRRALVGNRLVLVAPADNATELRIAPGFRLAAALGTGRLATGDPDTVPVGRYARSALVTLGVWDQIQPRLVRADNVRSAMMFVARGETPLGIVYATDALADSRVRIVDTFPAGSHPPITYPAAATRGARNIAVRYLGFLAGAGARDTWRKFGFVELEK
jgi:molybdate transport system substrate-binding protein